VTLDEILVNAQRAAGLASAAAPAWVTVRERLFAGGPSAANGIPSALFHLVDHRLVGAGHAWRQGRVNQIAFWSSFSDWKNQTLTPT
jgi:hypothetical protein